MVISCRFELSKPPDHPDFVTVKVGGKTIERDDTHANGWDIDHDELILEFYGDACAQLQAYPEEVEVIFGCPPVD
jgi:hypothetical protein